jgi:hypothetical protein
VVELIQRDREGRLVKRVDLAAGVTDKDVERAGGGLMVPVVVDGNDGALLREFEAMPRPIPRELPVMNACFPLSLMVNLLGAAAGQRARYNRPG